MEREGKKEGKYIKEKIITVICMVLTVYVIFSIIEEDNRPVSGVYKVYREIDGVEISKTKEGISGINIRYTQGGGSKKDNYDKKDVELRELHDWEKGSNKSKVVRYEDSKGIDKTVGLGKKVIVYIPSKEYKNYPRELKSKK